MHKLGDPDRGRVPGPLEERRQRAREAGWDAYDPSRSGAVLASVNAAIETATRVQVTPEVMAATRDAFEDHYGGSVKPIIEAVLRAAGFEVEE